MIPLSRKKLEMEITRLESETLEERTQQKKEEAVMQGRGMLQVGLL
jgi:hypothetical protein